MVELLLNNSKNKALRMSRNRAHILPVKKQQCTGSMTDRGVNKGVDHRSYAQVVSGAEARPAKVGNSNIPDKVKGVDHNQGGTCGIENRRHKGVRWVHSNATQDGDCPLDAKTTTFACEKTARDRGIVITCETASHFDPCGASNASRAEVFKGHNNSRSPITSVDSLGQTSTTTNTADLSCPLGKGQKVHSIQHKEVSGKRVLWLMRMYTQVYLMVVRSMT